MIEVAGPADQPDAFELAEERGPSLPCTRSMYQLAAEHGDGLAAEDDAIAAGAHPDDAAARRGLVADHLRLAEALRPEGGEATMGRSGDRILVDAGAGREEARHEIDPGLLRTRGHDDPAHRQRAERRELR